MTELHDLAGAYATDALEAPERTAFQTHLAECAACRTEVADAREVLGALAAARAVLPPPGLEDAVVAAAIRGPSALATPAACSAPPSPPAPVPTALPTDSTPLPGAHQADGDTPEALRVLSERRRPRRVSTWLIGAAAASALFAGGVLVGRYSAPADQTAGPTMDSILAVASAGDAHYMPVDLMGSQARVVVSVEMGKVAVLASDLPMPAKGQCYQVWKVAPDGTKTSAGVFTPDDDGHVAVVLEGGPDVVGFVVTLEPPGGSKAPTGEMVGQVTA